jgi:hypothetical protein
VDHGTCGESGGPCTTTCPLNGQNVTTTMCCGYNPNPPAGLPTSRGCGCHPHTKVASCADSW